MIQVGEELTFQDILCSIGFHVGKWGNPISMPIRRLTAGSKTKWHSAGGYFHQQYTCTHCTYTKRRQISDETL